MLFCERHPSPERRSTRLITSGQTRYKGPMFRPSLLLHRLWFFCIFWPKHYTGGSPYPRFRYPWFTAARKKFGKLQKWTVYRFQNEKRATARNMVKSSSPHAPSTSLFSLCPRTHASPQTCHHSSLCSFGNFPGVWSIKADVSELNVGSIVLGDQE